VGQQLFKKCMVRPTISSLQMGHKSFVLAVATADGPPFCKDTTELKSWLDSGRGEVAKGETVESLESTDTKLSAGEAKLDVR